MTDTYFTVLAPVPGTIVPLEQVPDPVFNQRMLGDGLAIDPAHGTLTAPFDGRIININPNLHAFVLEHNGVELLVHVGLDTIHLQGKGFIPLVKVGEVVKAGQPLLQFDLAIVRKKLQVPFVLCIITTPSKVKVHPVKETIIQAGQPLFTVHLPLYKDNRVRTQRVLESAPITVYNEHGLHARPAGLLARLCGSYPHPISVCKKDKCVNAKSIIGIMELAVAQGEQIIFKLEGPQTDATAFMAQLRLFFTGK